MKMSLARVRKIGLTRILVLIGITVVAAVAFGISRSHEPTLASLSSQSEQAPVDPVDTESSDQKPAEPIQPTPIVWRDNTNAEQGFSLRYPSNSQWSLSQGKNTAPANGRIYTSSVEYHETTSKEGINAFELVVAKKGSSQDFDLPNIKTVMAKNDFFELVKEEGVKVGGLSGMVLEYQAKKSDLGNIKYYFFEKNETVYNVVINYLGDKSETTNIVDFGDQILNSLEFSQ